MPQLQPSHCSGLGHHYHCASLDFRHHYPCLGAERKRATEPSDSAHLRDKHQAGYFQEDAASQLESDQGFSTDSLDKLVAPATKVQILQTGSL